MNDSKNYGWVRLHRKIENNPLWFLEPFTKAQAWIDLFLNANHKDGIIQIRGNIIKIKRGQIGWSELTMSKRWQWSKNKTRRFLKLLETEQQIEQQKTAITSIITILNYNNHQTDDTTDDTTERQQKDSRRYTNNNDKNEKNEKKRENKFSPPSLEEIKEYCQERDNGVNPEAFINFYESKGWLVGKNKMKDWKACVRTWEQRNPKIVKTPEDEVRELIKECEIKYGKEKAGNIASFKWEKICKEKGLDFIKFINMFDW